MKVVTSAEMSRIEHLAYQEGFSEEQFMNAAGKGVAEIAMKFVEEHFLEDRIILLAGKGNNGGDAYVAGIELLHQNFEVFAYQMYPEEECSPLCQKNLQKFHAEGGKSRHVRSIDDFSIPTSGVIIDGIFGTGFHGFLPEPIASVVQLINFSRLPVIAIDIPSGLNGNTGEVEGEAIKAAVTAFLGLPKIGFFLNNGWNHVGKLEYVDYGLTHPFVEAAKSELIMITHQMVKPFLPLIKPERHKYQAGHVVGLAGSPGMTGAAILSSYATLRGGAGIIHLLHPKGMECINAPWEIITFPYENDQIDPIISWLNKGSAAFVGPGLGRSEEARRLLAAVLPKIEVPCVIDGDALTIIAEENLQLPKKSVLTPHRGELKRLLHLENTKILNQDLLKACQSYAEKHQLTLVLKGGCSFIFHPDELKVVNYKGDPGMATAGSGDVLTGLIAALLAQGLPPHQATALGVYLQGAAGELAAEEKTSYGMVASDILENLPEVYKSFR